MPIFCKWTFSIKNKILSIGCKQKSIEELEKFFKSNKEYETKRATEDFFRIEAMFNAYKSYYETINKK